MLSKSFTASLFLLALTSSVTADCVITPALGVSGTPGTGDVQHPSTAAPCGNIPISQNIDNSTPVQAKSGQLTVSITNFVTGSEGSRKIAKVMMDPSGTGGGFVETHMVSNGDEVPANKDSQSLTAKLPDGIKCVGGENQNLCVASFVTGPGSGNCVVFTQPETTKNTTSTSTDGQKPQTNVQNGDQAKQNQKTEGDKSNGKKRMIRKRMV